VLLLWVFFYYPFERAFLPFLAAVAGGSAVLRRQYGFGAGLLTAGLFAAGAGAFEESLVSGKGVMVLSIPLGLSVAWLLKNLSRWSKASGTWDLGLAALTALLVLPWIRLLVEFVPHLF